MNDHDPLCNYPWSACVCHAYDRARIRAEQDRMIESALRARAPKVPPISIEQAEFIVDVADMMAAEKF